MLVGLAGEVFALHVGGVVAIRAVQHAVAIQRFHEARIGGANRLVALDLVEIFAAAQPSRGGDLRHQERFRAERFGRALLGVDAQPFDSRAHHDDAGHPDDHAQQRQEAAQLVRAERIRRQPERIVKLMPGARHPGTRWDHVFPG